MPLGLGDFDHSIAALAVVIDDVERPESAVEAKIRPAPVRLEAGAARDEPRQRYHETTVRVAIRTVSADSIQAVTMRLRVLHRNRRFGHIVEIRVRYPRH